MEYNEAVKQLFTDFKKIYYSIRRDILCNITPELSIPMKLVRLIKTCPDGTYSKAHAGKYECRTESHEQHFCM